MVGMWHCDDLEPFDAGKIRRVAGVNGETVRHRNCRDHRVVGTRRPLAARPSKRGGDDSERARRSSVEGEWVEVCLGELQMGLPRCAFYFGGRQQRADRQLGERHRGDEWLVGERLGR